MFPGGKKTPENYYPSARGLSIHLGATNTIVLFSLVENARETVAAFLVKVGVSLNNFPTPGRGNKPAPTFCCQLSVHVMQRTLEDRVLVPRGKLASQRTLDFNSHNAWRGPAALPGKSEWWRPSCVWSCSSPASLQLDFVAVSETVFR